MSVGETFSFIPQSVANIRGDCGPKLRHTFLLDPPKRHSLFDRLSTGWSSTEPTSSLAPATVTTA